MQTSRVTTHDDEILALRQQLISSIKFHHRETLQKIPLESAVKAMVEVWNTCHPVDLPIDYNCTSTAIIPKEQVAKSIRESKYFEDS